MHATPVNYNYDHFIPDDKTLGLTSGSHAGEIFPDLEVCDREGRRLPMSELAGRRFVLETGSVTCPHFLGNCVAMNQLAETFPKLLFLVLYVREEHPGEIRGAHHSIEEKFDSSFYLSQYVSGRRQILVDELGGTAHRALGGFPNMVYYVGENHKILFRENWNCPIDLQVSLSGLACAKLRDSNHAYPAHSPGVWTTLKTLARAGPTAAFEFARCAPEIALKRWKKRDHV